MILGGIIGAVVIPLLSDHYRKRTPYLKLAMIGAILGLVGITFASDYWLLLVSAFVFGFFLLELARSDFNMAPRLPIQPQKVRRMAYYCSWVKSQGLFSFWEWIYLNPR